MLKRNSPPTTRNNISVSVVICCLLFVLACGCGQARAIDFRGLVDLRVGTGNGDRSWTRDGLDKARFDRHSGAVRLGQAIVRADGEVLDSISGSVVASAADDRPGLLDINEAWLSWNPVPASAWKIRVKAGAFFPATNLEIDYDSVGWTPARTLSSSAINSWMGEELRTVGAELSMTRKGNLANSSHDFGFVAAVFNNNDPAGTLLAWRGWSISDRITGVTESLRLADLPVYRAGGALPDQHRNIHLFRELDNRVGYYTGVNYGYEGRVRIDTMHYDNRGDPMVLKNGQYSWKTRFNHLSARVALGDGGEVLLQTLRGNTLMGPNAVRLGYEAWYVLASHTLGPGTVTIRYDRFATTEHPADVNPADANTERGRARLLAYAWPVNRTFSIVTEGLEIRSARDARKLIGGPADRRERSVSTGLRWQF